jgi:peroxiredoxin
MRSRLLISLFTFLLLAALSSPGQGQQDPAKPITSPDHKLLTSLPKTVLNAELRAALGGTFRLSDYSGDVLVVNLWATWCAPCRLQIAALVKMQEQLRAQGVKVIVLSTENPDPSAEGVLELIREYEVNYQIGWATSEVSLTLMQGRDAIPQTFVISRSGRIIKRFVGFNPKDTPPLLELAIQEALNDKDDLPEQHK